jgi:alpha-tubulin suppressor-like RCC1 family protein
VLETLGGPSLSNIVEIATGYTHSCAVTTDHRVKCWGHNYYGQLGNGTFTQSYVPVDVVETAGGGPLGNIISVTAGRYFTCALTIGGEVKCWGISDNVQLGYGLTFESNVPVDVLEEVGGMPLTGITDIVASDGETAGNYLYGHGHTCALTTDSGMKCWGDNDFGQLGDGSTTDWRLCPVDVLEESGGAALSDIIDMAVGSRHTCALTSSGNVKCWGEKGYGQLGTGPVIFFQSIPVDVILW